MEGEQVTGASRLITYTIYGKMPRSTRPGIAPKHAPCEDWHSIGNVYTRTPVSNTCLEVERPGQVINRLCEGNPPLCRYQGAQIMFSEADGFRRHGRQLNATVLFALSGGRIQAVQP